MQAVSALPDVPAADGRDARGRFAPGRSGNPVGRKPGSKNKTTQLRAWLADGEDGAAVRVVVERMLQGDAVAARFLVDRLFPRPRGRAFALDLPDPDQAIGHAAIHDAALRAMVNGEITPDEARQVGAALHERRLRYSDAKPTASNTLPAALAPAEPPADRLQIPDGAGAAVAPAPVIAPRPIAPVPPPYRRRRAAAAGAMPARDAPRSPAPSPSDGPPATR